jgi:DNA sulfur modification protein DndD
MLINKVILNNINTFEGTHAFNFRPQSMGKKQKPIIIIGGKNGSGKTTIFDAIKLCLYGKQSLGKISHKQYSTYLKDAIHNSQDLLIQPNSAFVEVEFEYTSGGKVDIYNIIRFWENSKKSIDENLIIKRNGNELSDIEKDNWEFFIKDLIPYGLSEVFFFDGEKIKNMMADAKNEEFKYSLKSLFGIDLIERLQADLKIYKNKFLETISDHKYKKEINEYEKEKELIIANIRKEKDNIASIDGKIERLTEKIENYKNKISSQGGGFLGEKDYLKEKKTHLQNDIENTRNELREIAAGLLPVVIALKFSKRLKNQIQKEKEIKKIYYTKTFFNSKKKYIENEIKQENISFPNAEIKNILNLIEKKIDKSISKEVLIHNFSESQEEKILRDIKYAKEALPNQVKALIQQYESLFRALQQNEKNINMIPEEDIIKPMYEKLNSLYKELGFMLNQKETQENNLNDLLSRYNSIQKKIDTTLSEIEKNAKKYSKIELGKKVENALNIYHRKLIEHKINKLEIEFLNIFSKLHRKEDVISKISINKKNFDIFIYDKKNKKINKNKLSAGEKEVFAVSLVWALAKISGQNLPFLIDTPLARLDTEHRENLINFFFPKAAHQLVIFSTDTEIDKKYFQKLEPYISRSFYLDYIDKIQKTEEKDGYFWS